MRFPEFTEKWTCNHLKEHLSVNKERNKDNRFSKKDVLSVSGEVGIVNQIDLLGRSFAGQDVSDYHVVKKGNVVYTKSPLKEFPYGIIKVNRGSDGIVSTLYAVYDVLANTDGRFIEYYFSNKDRINRYLKPIVRIGAKHDMKIGNEEVLQNIIKVPSYYEQKRISDILDLISKRIEAQIRIIEDLKSLSDVICERLYNPSERDSWHTYKYADLFTISNERNSKLQYTNVLSASQEHGMIERNELNIDIKFEASSITNYKIVRPNQYVIHLRSFQGGFAYSEKTGICSPAYTILVPNEKLSSTFLKYYFTSKRFIDSLRIVTYGIRDGRSISVDEFLQMKVTIPDIAHQQHIVQVMQLWEEKIRTEEEYLSKLQQQKKYLLSSMFI